MTESIDINALIPVEMRDRIDGFLTWAGNVVSFAVTTDDENREACELLIKTSSAIKTLENDRKNAMAPYRDAIYGSYRAVLDKLENLNAALKKATAEYHDEQERKRLEAQRKLELEAAEARRRAEAEAEKARAKAEAARESGKDAVAERAEVKAQIAERAASAIVAPIVANTAKVEGVTYYKEWAVEITDKYAAIKAMAASDMFWGCLDIDLVELKKRMASESCRLKSPEGVRVFEETKSRIRGKR